MSSVQSIILSNWPWAIPNRLNLCIAPWNVTSQVSVIQEVRSQHIVQNRSIRLTTIPGELRERLPTFRRRTRQIDVRLKAGDFNTRAGVSHFGVIAVVPKSRRGILWFCGDESAHLSVSARPYRTAATYCPMVYSLSLAPQKTSTLYAHPSAPPTPLH